MKSTKQMLLRNDLLKVLKNPWPDMTMIPWYLVYTNINSALVTLGFVSILDDSTSVLHRVFLKNSVDIIRLCSESFTARSRYSDGMIRATRHWTNVVFSLRRELKGVFGILLKLQRIGRSRAKSYKLSLPERLMDLASRSMFFQNPTLQHVTRRSEDIILLTTNVNGKCAPIQIASQQIGFKLFIHGQFVVDQIIYNIVDYGGQGNCLFLAVAGSLRAADPYSVHTHKSLRQGVSEYYIKYESEHRLFIGARPCEVIFDYPDLPPTDIFAYWSWSDWGSHIAMDGVWGGSSEIIPLNVVIPDGFKVNIYDSASGVVHGTEHNLADDTILLVRYGGDHYTSLQKISN